MRQYRKSLSIVLILALLTLILVTPVRSDSQSSGSTVNATQGSQQDLSDLSIYLGMHTINFSQILSSGIGGYSGSKDLSGSFQRIIEALRNITLGCDTLSCLSQNRSARADMEQSIRELERSGYLDQSTVNEILRSIDQAYMSDEALRNIISDPEIAQLISNLSSSGAEGFPNALGILDSLFRGGRISLNQYIAALELLKRISLRQGLGDQAVMIDKTQLEVLKQLILSGTAEGLVKSLTNILSSTGGSGSTGQQGSEESRTTYLGAVPSNIYMPTPSSISGVDFLIIASIVISIAAITAIFMLGIPSAVLSLLRGSPRRGGPSPGEMVLRGGVIGIYWKAVGLLSRRVPRRVSETHREYLERVRESLDNPGSFADLTEIYERVRYAHEPEERHVERAIRRYEELERS